MDVKTEFLNRELEENLYMDQLEEYVAEGNEHKVRKLAKSLYDLKQAPKQWHEKFDKVLVSNGYLINEVDKYLNSFNYNTYVIFTFMLMIYLFFVQAWK